MAKKNKVAKTYTSSEDLGPAKGTAIPMDMLNKDSKIKITDRPQIHKNKKTK